MRYCFILVAAFILMISCKDGSTPGNEKTVSASDRLVKELADKADKSPDSLQYRLDVINVLDSLGRYREALHHMNLYLQKDSVSDRTWFRKGQLEEKTKDTAAAIRSYTTSVNINPTVEARLYLANLYAETKNDTALLLINWVSRENTEDVTLAECDFIAGVYHSRKGDIKKAIELFTRCISHERKYMEAYMEIGFMHYEQKKYNNALNIFRLAMEVEPTYADAFYWQGKTYEALGKTQEAINMYEEARELDPSLKEASDAVARLGGVRS